MEITREDNTPVGRIYVEPKNDKKDKVEEKIDKAKDTLDSRAIKMILNMQAEMMAYIWSKPWQ